MDFPDVSRLSINGAKTDSPVPGPNECTEMTEDPKFDIYARSLPYATEHRLKLLDMLDFIVLRLTQCLEARDYDVGLVQWDSMLN